MIAATLKAPDLGKALRSQQSRIDMELIVALQTNRGLLFDAEGSYNGHQAWAPLLLRSGQILSHRGVLRKSLAPGTNSGQAGPGGIAKAANGVVTIGTELAYAGMMNFGTTRMPGGVMRPVAAKALAIPMGKGKGVMFRKSVRIPARRFDTITQQDREEFDTALANVVREILSEAAS